MVGPDAQRSVRKTGSGAAWRTCGHPVPRKDRKLRTRRTLLLHRSVWAAAAAGRTGGYLSGEISRRGFTLIELVVSIGLISLLLALILPARNNARDASRRVQCGNNVRHVALAIRNTS